MSRPGRPDPPSRPRAAAADPRGGDGGAATVLMLALVSVAMVLALGVAAGGRVAVDRHRAEAAADLGALAAARAAQLDPDGACAVASRVVAAGGASLSTCVVEGFGRAVGITVRVRSWVSIAEMGEVVVTARARAGPVGSDP